MKKVSRKPGDDSGVFERQATLFKAFANPTRIHLLELLGRGELGASELQRRLGISKANLSQHLSILRAAGVVNSRREGKRLICELASSDVKQVCVQLKLLLKGQGRNHRGA